MKIFHSVPKINRILGSLINSNFWHTQVHRDGIEITRIIGAPILIRWETIQCLDLSGLKEPSNLAIQILGPKYKKRALKERFFLIMIEDQKLVQKACTLTSDLKTWFVAKNVLGIAGIDANCSIRLSSVLQQEAQRHKINLDRIWIEDF